MLQFVRRLRAGVRDVTVVSGTIVIICLAIMAFDIIRSKASAITQPVPVRQDDPAIVVTPHPPEVTDGTRPAKVIVWYDAEGVPTRATVWWIERVAGKRDHRWTSETMGADEAKAVLWQAGLEWRD